VRGVKFPQWQLVTSRQIYRLLLHKTALCSVGIHFLPSAHL
jgi:hypothetical protein